MSAFILDLVLCILDLLHFSTSSCSPLIFLIFRCQLNNVEPSKGRTGMVELRYSNVEREMEVYGYDSATRSHCRMCHGGCGVIVYVKDGRVAKIAGDPECPINHGTICSKGLASAQLAYHPDRLTYPVKRVGPKGSGRWERITWDEALDTDRRTDPPVQRGFRRRVDRLRLRHRPRQRGRDLPDRQLPGLAECPDGGPLLLRSQDIDEHHHLRDQPHRRLRELPPLRHPLGEQRPDRQCGRIQRGILLVSPSTRAHDSSSWTRDSPVPLRVRKSGCPSAPGPMRPWPWGCSM